MASIDDKDPVFEHNNWMKRNHQHMRNYSELIVGTTRIWMEREATLNSLVCIVTYFT
jgi:hypothetical protein